MIFRLAWVFLEQENSDSRDTIRQNSCYSFTVFGWMKELFIRGLLHAKRQDTQRIIMLPHWGT